MARHLNHNVRVVTLKPKHAEFVDVSMPYLKKEWKPNVRRCQLWFCIRHYMHNLFSSVYVWNYLQAYIWLIRLRWSASKNQLLQERKIIEKILPPKRYWRVKAFGRLRKKKKMIKIYRGKFHLTDVNTIWKIFHMIFRLHETFLWSSCICFLIRSSDFAAFDTCSIMFSVKFLNNFNFIKLALWNCKCRQNCLFSHECGHWHWKLVTSFFAKCKLQQEDSLVVLLVVITEDHRF